MPGVIYVCASMSRLAHLIHRAFVLSVLVGVWLGRRVVMFDFYLLVTIHILHYKRSLQIASITPIE